MLLLALLRSPKTLVKAVRLLVTHEPEGLPAGEIARKLGVLHNTMSAHLAVLARAGWVVSQRQSRQIIYHASLTHMETVIQFLLKDCCVRHPELFGSLLESLSGSDINTSDKPNN